MRELSALPGPSGYESPVAERARELLAPLVDRTEIDRMGNLIGYLSCGKPGAKTVLLDAHIDEIGVMVTGEDKGFYSFRTLGHMDPRILPACEILLLTTPPTPAVVACLPPHVLTPAETDKSQPVDELFLDTGGVPIEIGTVGVYRQTPVMLGDKLLSGKSLDNRASFAVLLRTLELLDRDRLGADVVICGSVQEEVGGRGARAAAWAVHPDYAVAVDVTYGATPDGSGPGTFTPSGGPCVGMGPECNRKLSQRLIALAKEKEIPYQVEVMPGRSGTNAAVLQTAREGVVTGILSVPLKYMHTPVETLRTDDAENTAKLLGEWVMSL